MIHADPRTGNVDATPRTDAEYLANGYTRTFLSVADYNKWRDENFTPQEVEPPAPTVPHEVSNQQLRLALIASKIYPSAILSMLQSMPPGDDKERALAAWEYANTFRRDHHLVASLALQLGLSSVQVDALFIHAATLG